MALTKYYSHLGILKGFLSIVISLQTALKCFMRFIALASHVSMDFPLGSLPSTAEYHIIVNGQFVINLIAYPDHCGR